MQTFTHRNTEIRYPADYTDSSDYRLKQVWLRTNKKVQAGKIFLVVDLDVSLHWILQEAQPLADKNAPIEEIKGAIARGFLCSYYQCSSAIYHPESPTNLFVWWEVTGYQLPSPDSQAQVEADAGD